MKAVLVQLSATIWHFGNLPQPHTHLDHCYKLVNPMRKFHKNFCLFTFTFALGVFLSPLFAQNNLKVGFRDPASAPPPLSVCDGESVVTVAVSTDGSSSTTRQNIQAQMKLFKGVQMVRFEPAGSSPGVSLTDFTDPTKPIFSLPNLTPGGSSTVNIQYVIRVNCGYMDTLNNNGTLNVVDTWDFTYDMGASTGIKESDLSTPYRDPVRVPRFTLFVENNAPSGARIGGCFQRNVFVDNGSLAGWIKNFVYTNSQGPGISVKSITVNGRSIPFTKNATFNATGDTLITMFIPDSIFKYNTIGSSGNPADGDNLFESDEKVTIVEEFCIVNCDDSRISTHEMAWGCDSRFCTALTRTDNIPIGLGSVNIGFNPSGSVPQDTVGYCKAGSQTVTFENTGVEVDPGTGTMFDIATGIGLSDFMKLSLKGYRITSMKIAGVTIPLVGDSAVIDVKNNPLFAADPDGPGGLEDKDSDGFYDDLAVNEKYEVTITYEVDCAANTIDDNCRNNFETSLSAHLYYTDLCLRNNTYTRNSFFRIANTNDYVENCVDPDAKTDGTIFFMEHTEIRVVSEFERNCNGQERLEVAIKMPQGVSAVNDSMLLYWNDAPMPLLNAVTSNDTVYLQFNGTAAQYLTGEYKLRMAFTANCSAIPGNTAFSIQTAFYCPPCDCRHIWYCDTLVGPRIHYAETCPPNLAYDCNKGLKTTDFKVVRTTLGYTDETYATKIDAADANLNVAMACDSVRMTVKNIVGKTALPDSIGILISYDNITRNDTNKLKDIFVFDKGTLVITHGGMRYTRGITPSVLRTVRTDTSKAMYFDLQPCLVALGIAPLVAGDSVNFVGNFSIKADGPYRYNFDKVPNFRALGYYIEDDSLYSCDNYGAMFRVGKSQALFSFPSSSSFPVGCAEATLDYKITMFNNDFAKFFGGEFRQSVGVDSILLVYDPNFTTAFTTSVSASIPDHPFYDNAFFPLANLTNSGRYSVRFDTLTRVPSLNRLTSYAFDLRIKVRPNCATVTGSINGDSVYRFEPTISYRDRYYARYIGDGSCSPYLQEMATTGNDKIVHSSPAKLDFVSFSNPNITIVNDTANWTMKLCNASTLGSAEKSWIAITPANVAPSFRVIEVKDMTDNLNIRPMPFKYYGTDSTKAFAFLDGLQPVTPTTSIDDVCNVVSVKAIFRECGTSNINFRAGWLCALPTDPNWNPTDYTPCNDSIVRGQVRTENPFIDAYFINQSTVPNSQICDTTTLEILLRNTDIGYAYAMRSRLTIPEGATLLNSSIQVAYPPSAPYQAVTATPSVVGVDAKGTSYEFADFNGVNDHLNKFGLKGFNPASPTDSNEFKIRFKFLTECGYKSGSLTSFSFIGKTVCGTPTNAETGESLPIEIVGAQLSSPKNYNVSVGLGNKFVPGGVTNFELTFTNLTNTASDASDIISVKLPGGIRYKAGSTETISPSSWNPGEPAVRISPYGGYQILSWNQPIGLLRNESASLQFSVTTADSLPCVGSKEVVLATYATRNLVCNTSGSICKTEIITTSGGEQFFGIPLSKGSILMVSNLQINGDTIVTLTGDSVAIAALGGQRYTWYDMDSGATLSTDSIYKFVPNKAITRLGVKSSLNGGCLDSAKVFIKIGAALERHDTIYRGDSLKYCFSTLNLAGTIDSVANICNSTSNRNATYTIDAAKCVTFTGIKLGTDTACFKVCTDLGNCKEIRFFTTVILRPLDTIKITQTEGDSTTICFPTNRVGGTTFTLRNVCANPLDTVVTYTVTKDTCVTIKAINKGVSKSCWELCSNSGKCDTTIIVTTVTAKPIVAKRDTIFKTILKGQKDTICLSTAEIGGSLFTVTNFCPNPSDTIVTYGGVNDTCLVITGRNLGSSTSCWALCSNNGKCDTTIVITKVVQPVTLPMVDTIRRTVTVGAKDTVCFSTSEIGGTGFTLTNFCLNATDTVASYTKFSDTCIVITANKLGSSSSCWALCNNAGKCDTTIIITTVIPAVVPKDTIKRTVVIGTKDTVCLSTTKIGGTGFTLTNVCPIVGDTVASYTTLGDTCVVISGNKLGKSTSCWALCNNAGKCDTTIIVTTVVNPPVVPKDTIRRTVVVGTKDTVCLSTTKVGGTGFTITNVCAIAGDTVASYTTTNDVCVIISGNKLGKSTSCWALCNNAGKCDTTIIITTVVAKNPTPKTDTIYRTVEVGKLDTVCFTFRRKITSPIYNICPDSAGTDVEFTLINGDSCVVSKGLKVGKGKSCWVMCDSVNKCDTVIIITTVIKGNLLPIAEDDSVTTKINTPITIKVMTNDTINGTFVKIELLTPPQNGIGVFKQDSAGNWVFEYIPDAGYCNSKEPDEFVYQLCNQNGCDMAMVKVKIACGFKIYNAFSPNGDDKNQVFFIDGLESYPNTKVIIYNRWGNKIYENSDYKNNWDGKWNNNEVPDGTYFYQVLLENGEVYTGYLQIHR
jgi:gliding motility-associated-like protein